MKFRIISRTKDCSSFLQDRREIPCTAREKILSTKLGLNHNKMSASGVIFFCNSGVVKTLFY